jgi:hypothetical protein
MRLADWIFTYLGGGGDGWCVPPGANSRLEFGEPSDDGRPMHVATTYNNDGFELWLGYRKGRWHCFFQARDARRLAWWILWRWWFMDTWCGLKRTIWYWALHRRVTAYRCKPEEKSS